MCGSIASDEGRHEIAYQRIMDKLFELDPDGSVLAFADMMRKQIVMPAHLMDDGQHGANNGGRNLFSVRGVGELMRTSVQKREQASCHASALSAHHRFATPTLRRLFPPAGLFGCGGARGRVHRV